MSKSSSWVADPTGTDSGKLEEEAAENVPKSTVTIMLVICIARLPEFVKLFTIVTVAPG
jgi:hypothetical protein